MGLEQYQLPPHLHTYRPWVCFSVPQNLIPQKPKISGSFSSRYASLLPDDVILKKMHGFTCLFSSSFSVLLMKHNCKNLESSSYKGKILPILWLWTSKYCKNLLYNQRNIIRRHGNKIHLILRTITTDKKDSWLDSIHDFQGTKAKIAKPPTMFHKNHHQQCSKKTTTDVPKKPPSMFQRKHLQNSKEPLTILPKKTRITFQKTHLSCSEKTISNIPKYHFWCSKKTTSNVPKKTTHTVPKNHSQRSKKTPRTFKKTTFMFQ